MPASATTARVVPAARPPRTMTRSAASTSAARRSSTDRRVISAPDRAEDALEVGVAEQPGRVQAVAQRRELVEPRIAPAEDVGVQPVQLPPVRPAGDLARDRLEGGEPRSWVGARGDVRRDVGGLPAA